MAGVNFMDNFKGVHGNFGKKSRDRAIAAGYNPSQVKTALQQQGNAGYLLGSGLKTDRMHGVKGAAHGMSRYQGYHGNIGLNSYMKARMDGYTHDQIQQGAQSQGMFLAQRASQQYQWDKQNAEERDHMLNYMKQLEEMLAMPRPSNQVGRSASYSVGTAGAQGISEGDDEPSSRRDRGTYSWNRESASTAPWSSALSTGAAATGALGAGMASSGGTGKSKPGPLNVAST